MIDRKAIERPLLRAESYEIFRDRKCCLLSLRFETAASIFPT
jgi:hypothetical protein